MICGRCGTPNGRWVPILTFGGFKADLLRRGRHGGEEGEIGAGASVDEVAGQAVCKSHARIIIATDDVGTEIKAGAGEGGVGGAGGGVKDFFATQVRKHRLPIPDAVGK